MKLTFLGADREVTGSCTQLEAAGHRFLIDCGMEQGRDVYENADLPCAPGTYEALLLTHAHIDHSGRIPYLYKNGYRGPIYTTDATRDLCAIMLEDSAHIQEQEAEWKNRKAMRSGAEMIEPDYTVEDAQNVMKQFVPCPYEAWQTLFDGPTGKIEMRFTDVGHLLGSASVSLRIAEPGRTPEIIVFSGDIGNTHQPLIKDPSNPGHADYLVMESTYGDRSHGPKPDYIGDLSAVLQSTFDKGGNVVIPSFAVGRTQELLYFIRQIKAEGRIKGHENFPVFVDSPLASKSTTIFRENFAECYDDEALALVQSGRNPLQFPGLHVSETKEESMAINGDLTFNPLRDELINESGRPVRLDEPRGDELPAAGFEVKDNGYAAPDPSLATEVVIAPGSQRLQRLAPFAPWDGRELEGLRLLIQASGKCTTDHISMAGPWLRFRGHLENISDNLLMGAVNRFNGRTNSVLNTLDGSYASVSSVAKGYKEQGIGSIVVAEENYGEGSSREHAALEPRFLNVRAVLVKSFARIHETNLKKQGMLALTFVDPSDYDRIREDDRISITGLRSFAPGSRMTVTLLHSDGTSESFEAAHTYNEQQIGWFKAGSALNVKA